MVASRASSALISTILDWGVRVFNKREIEVGLDAKIVQFGDSGPARARAGRSYEVDVLLRQSDKPLSSRFVAGLLRALELFAVGLPGIVGYLALVHRTTPDAALRYFSTIAIGMLIASVLFQMSKVYSLDYVFARTLRFERVLMAWVAVGCSLIVIAFGLKISGFYSRIWVGTWFVSTTLFLFAGRAIFSRWARRWSEAGRFADRTVIVGAGEQGQRLAAHLKAGGDYQTRVVGFVDDRKTRLFRGADQSKLLGDSHDLIQYIRDGLVDQVFIALPWSA